MWLENRAFVFELAVFVFERFSRIIDGEVFAIGAMGKEIAALVSDVEREFAEAYFIGVGELGAVVGK